MAGTSQTVQQYPSRFWRGYFFLLGFLIGLSLLSGSGSLLNVFLALFNAFGLAGLWGYITQAAVGWRAVWGVYFCLSLAVNGLLVLLQLRDVVNESLPPLAFLAFSALPLVPLYIALWRYVCRSPSAWTDQ